MNLPHYRVGSGYDAHRFSRKRGLVLGGVDIPFDKGLLGHSDADVVVHAICDAILGAAGMGDIGECFPDTDPAYSGISSLILLQQCRGYLRDKGYTVSSIDATVIAAAPKISPYRQQMEANIASAAGVTPDLVNIKGTTTEGLGFEGRGEGISARSVVLIKRINREIE